MYNIGQKIKKLRRKNDLTQEKLADYLGVTYQCVSKWECGVTSPDLSLIAPLTRLFHVSADELLGLTASETDERRAYFDAECFEYWKKDDHEADYKIAQQAVAEYPGDFRYLDWLASVEYYIAFDDNYRSGGPLDYFNDMMERSIRHYLMILDDCTDEELRNKALWGLILDYKFTNRLEEAKKYAMMYPEYTGTSRDDALELCLEGEDLLAHRQKMVADALYHMNRALVNIYNFGDRRDPRVRAAAEACLAIHKAVVPDENYLGFNGCIQGIHTTLAEIHIAEGDFENAVRELAVSKQYAVECDRCCTSGRQYYTCPLLDHYDYDYYGSRQYSHLEDWYEYLNQHQFDPIRNYPPFQSLCQPN